MQDLRAKNIKNKDTKAFYESGFLERKRRNKEKNGYFRQQG
jgi:hypothetical protein